MLLFRRLETSLSLHGRFPWTSAPLRCDDTAHSFLWLPSKPYGPHDGGRPALLHGIACRRNSEGQRSKVCVPRAQTPQYGFWRLWGFRRNRRPFSDCSKKGPGAGHRGKGELEYQILSHRLALSSFFQPCSRNVWAKIAVPTADKSPHVRCGSRIAVGTRVTSRPPHRTVRAQFGHTAPTLGV